MEIITNYQAKCQEMDNEEVRVSEASWDLDGCILRRCRHNCVEWMEDNARNCGAVAMEIMPLRENN